MTQRDSLPRTIASRDCVSRALRSATRHALDFREQRLLRGVSGVGAPRLDSARRKCEHERRILEPEVHVEIGIAVEPQAPGPSHISKLAIRPLDLFCALIVSARRPFVMVKKRKRRPNVAIAFRTNLEAEVDIVVS